MSFLELCEKYFGSKNLYEVLNIDKNATDKEVRKAYHKLSLSCHPDRVEESKKLDATEKFKVLGKVHSILGDKEKRSIYDESGTWDNEDDEGSFEDRDWMEYWRCLFKKITISDIQKYEKEYKGSDSELRDLRKAYEGGRGDMDVIFEMVPFATLDDEERLRERIQSMIDSGELPSYEMFTNEPKAKRDRRVRKLKKEEKEAEECRKKQKTVEDNGMEDLAQAILAKRQINSDNFLDALEKKYSKANGDQKKSTRGKKAKTAK